jgi:hypothetical protein
MNEQTGEIKDLAKLTEAEKKDKNWIPLTADQHTKAKGMNRAQRRAYAKQLRKQMAKMKTQQHARPGTTPGEVNTPGEA